MTAQGQGGYDLLLIASCHSYDSNCVLIANCYSYDSCVLIASLYAYASCVLTVADVPCVHLSD